MDIDEIVRTLRQLITEVEKLKNNNSSKDDILIEGKIAKVVKEYPIKGHILCNLGEKERIDYISMLLFLSDTDFEELRLKRRMMIYRIIASFDEKIDISEYITKSLKINKKMIEEFIDLLGCSVKCCFIVDLMILILMDKVNSSKDELNMIADVIELMGLKKNIVSQVTSISKSIIIQDFSLFCRQCIDGSEIEYDRFLGYFEGVDYTGIATNYFEAVDLPGRILVLNTKLNNINDYINIDEFEADNVEFKLCNFINIRGIRSNSKKLIFDSCYFQGNVLSNSEQTESNIFEQYFSLSYEKGYVFIEGRNIKFINTSFVNCSTSEYLLKLSDSEIIECKFRNCKGVQLPCTFLLDMTNSTVTHSQFIECKVQTDDESRLVISGGILNINYSKVKNCRFENCISYGKTSNDFFVNYYMNTIYAINSSIEDNEFSGCKLHPTGENDVITENYIITLNNSLESNNSFFDCISEQHNNVFGGRNNLCVREVQE